MRDYDKNKEPSYIQYWDINKLFDWAISKKLPVNNFEWINNTYQLINISQKKYKEEMDEGYFLKVDVQYPKKLHEFYNGLTLFI